MITSIRKGPNRSPYQKHKPRTLKTPDEVNILGTGKNANIDGKEGPKKENPHTKGNKG